MEGSMSLADYLAVADRNDRGGMLGGNAGFMWVILIFLFFLAFNGGWGGFGTQQAATDFNLSQVERDVLTSSCATQKEVLQNRYDNAVAMNNLGYQMNQCCCDIKTAIHEDGEATRTLVTENVIQSLRDQLTVMQNTLQNQVISNNIVNQLRPMPVPAYITCSPYATSYNGYNYCSGCGTNATLV